MSSFLYKKSGIEFSSIPESVYPKISALLFYLGNVFTKGYFVLAFASCIHFEIPIEIATPIPRGRKAVKLR